jgi:YVTN family beta-propeller protein
MTLRQVGPYRLDSLLGAGGMGEVYKAYDTQRDRYVALKLLPQAFSGDQEYLKRFQRESHVAARLREPHVIPIHDFGEIDGQLFIDMRMVDGSDIGALLDANGRIAPQQATYIVSQVAQALDAAHADQLVHRDIKPSNILVTPNDFVYVVDFGIARSFGSRQTALTITGATIGTLHYMAPERFAGQSVDGRADVYSLACVLYECLTGIPPFSGKDLPALIYAQLYSGPPEASTLVEGVPPAMDAVIARGMAKDPQDRFPTAGMLAAAAREALLTEAPASLPPMRQLQAPIWAETPAPPPVTEPQAAATWAALPEQQAPTQEAPTWTDTPTPAWPAPAAGTAWQQAAQPQGPGAEPAGSRSAPHVPDTPTQTVLAASAGDWGGTRPPEYLPPVSGPGPDGGRLPPGEGPDRPERKPAWRRLSLLLLAAAVVLGIPLALILTSGKSNPGGTTAAPNTGGATRTSPAGAASTVQSVANSVAVPTVAGKIQVGQTPSWVQVAPNGKFAYITSPGSGTVTVLNTANDLVSKVIKIPQGPPQFVSFSPDSRTAYVSVYNTKGSVHLVAFIDTATSAVTSTVVVDNHTPGPSTASPDGRFLYVPNHNTAMTGSDENVVDVIDTASKKLTSKIAVPANPHWVAFDKNGRFYTSDHMSATVTVLDAHSNSIITEIEVGETPHSEAISPDGSRLAVTSFDGNEVFLIDTTTDKMIARIPVGRNPLDIAYSPNGRYLYTANNEDNTVTVIDTTTDKMIATVPTGKAPTSISVLPNGHQAYVSDENDGTIEILNLPK